MLKLVEKNWYLAQRIHLPIPKLILNFHESEKNNTKKLASENLQTWFYLPENLWMLNKEQVNSYHCNGMCQCKNQVSYFGLMTFFPVWSL